MTESSISVNKTYINQTQLSFGVGYQDMEIWISSRELCGQNVRRIAKSCLCGGSVFRFFYFLVMLAYIIYGLISNEIIHPYQDVQVRVGVHTSAESILEN